MSGHKLERVKDVLKVLRSSTAAGGGALTMGEVGILEACANSQAALLMALKAMAARYVRLAGSGDCGSWDVDGEAEVIGARYAIAKAEGR